MEHTNLFFFENKSALETAYPNGVVDEDPGVAYARGSGNEEYTVIYNNKVTNYTVTLLLQDKSGVTIAQSVTAETPDVLDGEPVKFKVVAPAVEDYKPRRESEKIEVTGDTSYTVVYLSKTDFIITVHHMFDGDPITADTQVVVENVWEETPVRVKIEPESVPGYKAQAVTITVSGSCDYNLEYEESVYEAVDLGLTSGTLWCDRNVGASAPEEGGNFYAWGEIATKSQSEFTEEDYRFYNGYSEDYTKYNDSDGFIELDLEDDAANVELGGDWHMPTPNQIYELVQETTSALTTVNGVSGVRLTSTSNGNSIFFPFVGAFVDGGQRITDAMGIWSNSLNYGGGPKADNQQLLGATSSINPLVVISYNQHGESGVGLTDMIRWYGLSVRGVQGIGPSPYNSGID